MQMHPRLSDVSSTPALSLSRLLLFTRSENRGLLAECGTFRGHSLHGRRLPAEWSARDCVRARFQSPPPPPSCCVVNAIKPRCRSCGNFPQGLYVRDKSALGSNANVRSTPRQGFWRLAVLLLVLSEARLLFFVGMIPVESQVRTHHRGVLLL